MYSFDPSTKTVEQTNKFLKSTFAGVDSDGYDLRISPAYLSYQKFLEEDLRNIIMEEFLPAYREAIGRARDDETFTILNPEQDIKISYATLTKTAAIDRTRHILVKFYDSNISKFVASEEVDIFTLPNFTKDGVLEWKDGKNYSFIHLLEERPTLTYNEPTNTSDSPVFKIKSDQGNSIQIDFNKFKLSLGKGAKFNLLDAIATLTAFENSSQLIEDILKQYSNISLMSAVKRPPEVWLKEGITTNDLEASLVPENIIGSDEYNSRASWQLNRYKLAKARDVINQTLSLDRAVGQTLAVDAVTPLTGNVIIPAGTVLSQEHVDTCKKAGVCYLQVVNNDMTQCYTAEMLYIQNLRAGTKISPELRQHLSRVGINEPYMYISKDITLEPTSAYLIKQNTLLTEDDIGLLNEIGYTFMAKKTKTSKSVFVHKPYREIISNGSVPGGLLGAPGTKWFYYARQASGYKFVPEIDYLRAQDLLAIISLGFELQSGSGFQAVRNTDSSFDKRVSTVQDKFRSAMIYSIKNSFRRIQKPLRDAVATDANCIVKKSNSFEGIFVIFGTNFLKYLRDSKAIEPLAVSGNQNPLANMSSLTKINTYTASKNSVSDIQRQIAIATYGKIDPYETPQSNRLGVVSNATVYCRIGLDGELRTPYYTVDREHSRLNPKIEWLTSKEEESLIFGDLSTITLSDDGRILNGDDIVLLRAPNNFNKDIDRQTFITGHVKDIQITNCYADEMLSWVTASIPFVGSNDAARVLFADAQIKEAKALVASEEPYVMTPAYKEIPKMSSRFSLYVDNPERTVDFKNFKYRRDTANQKKHAYHHLPYDSIKDISQVRVGDIYSESGASTGLEDEDYDFHEYLLGKNSACHIRVSPYNKNFNGSDERNQSGASHAKNLSTAKNVNRHYKVTSSYVSDNGILSTGINALTVFMPSGYNYEDGYHISKSFAKRMSSYVYNTEEIFINSRAKEEKYVYVPKLDFYDTELKIKANETRLLLSYKESAGSSANERFVTPKESTGYLFTTRPGKSNLTSKGYNYITLTTVDVKPAERGDKFANRHGNKGVTNLVQDDERMPKLLNGKACEVVLNPLGVGHRRNLGQVLEAKLGLVAHIFGIKFMTNSISGISTDDVFKWVKLLYRVANSTTDSEVITAIANSGLELDADLQSQIKYSAQYARTWAGVFDEEGQAIIGIYNDEGDIVFTEKATIGYVYYNKMLQESADKEHARAGYESNEPILQTHRAPTKGGHGGGQRAGTMETAAIAAYDATDYLYELLNQRCDNDIAKQEFIRDTFFTSNIKDDWTFDNRGQRMSVTQVLCYLLAMGIVVEDLGNDIVPIDKDTVAKLTTFKDKEFLNAGQNYYISTKKKAPETLMEFKVEQVRELKAQEQVDKVLDLSGVTVEEPPKVANAVAEPDPTKPEPSQLDVQNELLRAALMNG